MLPQQKLIILSLISVCIIAPLIGWYIYKKKAKTNFLIVLLLLSVLPIVSIFRPGSYESGDLSINVYKTMALFISLRDGVFPANWAGVLNATYGYPLFNFTYPLPYYLGCFFHIVGFSFLDSLKLVLSLSFISSGAAMYYFLKTHFSSFNAFVGAVLYLYAPYHLVDMHFRVDIGETVAFTFIPLLFLFGTKLIKNFQITDLIFLSLSTCGLLLSHQAVSLITLPFFALYIVVLWGLQKYPLRKFIPIFIAIILGFSLAGFYLLPVMFELQYTLQPTLAQITFVPLLDLIYSSWRYGFLFQGHQGELSFIIGYTQLLFVGIAVILFCKKRLTKHDTKLLVYCFFSFLFLFIMMLSISQPLWYILPFFKHFQFSYRLLSFIIFITAFMGAIASLYLPKKWVYFLLFLAIFSTILNWGNRRNLPEITDSYLSKNLALSTGIGEGLDPADPKWVDPKKHWFTTLPARHMEIKSGNGIITEISRNTTAHQYIIKALTPLNLYENTLFFPGWNIYVNDKKIPIHISSDTGKKGIMQFSLPKGEHTVNVSYLPTPVRQAGIFLSLISISILGILALIGYKKYSFKIDEITKI